MGRQSSLSRVARAEAPGALPLSARCAKKKNLLAFPGSKHMVKTRAGAHNGQLSPCVGSGRGFGGFLGLRERLFSLRKCRRGRSYPRQVEFLNRWVSADRSMDRDWVRNEGSLTMVEKHAGYEGEEEE
ncbi:hypothetical protein EJB05_05575, partial [Eragrostis curvula]